MGFPCPGGGPRPPSLMTPGTAAGRAMKRTGIPERVNVYLRPRGADERYRLLVSECSSDGQDSLSLALEVIRKMRADFPEYEFLLLIVGPRRLPREG